MLSFVSRNSGNWQTVEYHLHKFESFACRKRFLGGDHEQEWQDSGQGGRGIQDDEDIDDDGSGVVDGGGDGGDGDDGGEDNDGDDGEQGGHSL